MNEIESNFSGYRNEYSSFLSENGIHDETFHGKKIIEEKNNEEDEDEN